MENKDQTYERIELYLLDKLDPADKERFESELESNKVLAEQLHAQKLEHELMESIITSELKQQLEGWRNEIDTKDSDNHSAGGDNVITFNRSFRSYVAIAASVAVLIAVFVYNGIKDNTNPELQVAEEIQIEDPEKNDEVLYPEDSKQEQFADEVAEEIEDAVDVIQSAPKDDYSVLANLNYEEFDFNAINVNVRGNPNPMTTAIDHFANKRFDEGEEILKSILNENNAVSSARYYLGLAYYNQKEYMNAVSELKVLVENDQSYLYIDNSKWILALSHLSLNQPAEAMTLLEQLTGIGNTELAGKAKELLIKIKD